MAGGDGGEKTRDEFHFRHLESGWWCVWAGVGARGPGEHYSTVGTFLMLQGFHTCTGQCRSHCAC